MLLQNLGGNRGEVTRDRQPLFDLFRGPQASLAVGLRGELQKLGIEEIDGCGDVSFPQVRLVGVDGHLPPSSLVKTHADCTRPSRPRRSPA